MTDFKSLLRVLAERGVEFILVGGVAATVHGATRLTLDVGVVYRRSRQNIDRLVLVLTPSRTYLRGAPPGLPFRWDTATVERGLNFTLTTDAVSRHARTSRGRAPRARPTRCPARPAA
jgi:hypothetical protein